MKTKNFLFAGAIALSTVLSPMAALTQAIPVFADEQTVTETVVNNTTNHTYDAYQVFKGTQDIDATTPQLGLADVEWGDGINSTAEGFLAALHNITVNDEKPFANCNDAAAVAEVLTSHSEFDNDFARAFAAFADQYKSATRTTIPAGNQVTLRVGYYLIVDTTKSNDVEGGYKNLSLLQATKNGKLEITQKNNVPNVEKKVTDEVEGKDTYQDEADHEIGETFSFQLKATLNGSEQRYKEYKKYKLVFNDELSAGISFGAADLENPTVENVIKSVTVDGVSLNPADYSAKIDGQKLTVTIGDLVELKASKKICNFRCSNNGFPASQQHLSVF